MKFDRIIRCWLFFFALATAKLPFLKAGIIFFEYQVGIESDRFDFILKEIERNENVLSLLKKQQKKPFVGLDFCCGPQKIQLRLGISKWENSRKFCHSQKTPGQKQVKLWKDCKNFPKTGTVMMHRMVVVEFLAFYSILENY